MTVALWIGVCCSAAPGSKVVIAYSSLNERGAGALLVARDQGFFRKYDLDVQLIFMGSHLWRNSQDRVWFDFPDLVIGGLAKLAWGAATGSDAGDGITPENLFGMSYGDVCL